MTDSIFRLPDGRQLGYALYGPAEGERVFYFHGTPSSRLEPLLLNMYNKNLDTFLQKYMLRLIAVDRPGNGNSSFNKKGTFSSFAKDVSQLAVELKVTCAKVLCWSGGGPYALAIAFHFPQLIQSVHIITGFIVSFSTPGIFTKMSSNKYYFGAAKYAPWFMRLIMNYVGKKEADKSLSQIITGLPDVDHNLLADPVRYKVFNKVTINEACKNSSKGLVYEAGLYFRKFDFNLKEIKQPIHYWWGSSDNVVNKVHAEAVEDEAPSGILHYKENEGHLSIYINYFEEVLREISSTKDNLVRIL